MDMDDLGLWPKQRAFINEYLVDGNATQAAIRAGYSKRCAGKTGHELLKHPKIKEGLTRKISGTVSEEPKNTGVTVERIIRGLYDEATAKGFNTSHAARVTAWTTLGKIYGLLTDGPNIVINAEIRAILEDLSNEHPEIATLVANRISERTGSRRGLGNPGGNQLPGRGEQ
jgi:hypothetical protein